MECRGWEVGGLWRQYVKGCKRGRGEEGRRGGGEEGRRGGGEEGRREGRSMSRGLA